MEHTDQDFQPNALFFTYSWPENGSRERNHTLGLVIKIWKITFSSSWPDSKTTSFSGLCTVPAHLNPKRDIVAIDKLSKVNTLKVAIGN